MRTLEAEGHILKANPERSLVCRAKKSGHDHDEDEDDNPGNANMKDLLVIISFTSHVGHRKDISTPRVSDNLRCIRS